MVLGRVVAFALAGITLVGCTQGTPAPLGRPTSSAPARDQGCLSADRPGLVSCAHALRTGGEYSMTNTHNAWLEQMTDRLTGNVVLVWMVRSYLVPTQLDGPRGGCILTTATIMVDAHRGLWLGGSHVGIGKTCPPGALSPPPSG